MDYVYTDYQITLSGRDLVADSSIKIMKYENKVSRLVFNIDNNELLENAKLYLALLNPETKRYHYEPLIDNAVVIGTAISYYPGKHKMILIGVTPSFELDDSITLDLSAAIFVSKEFSKLVVLDNFINDDSIALSLPNFDDTIDHLVVLHDNVVELSIETAEDATACADATDSCSSILEQCQQILAECQDILAQIHDESNTLSSAFNTYRNQLQSDYERYYNSLREEAERIVQG